MTFFSARPCSKVFSAGGVSKRGALGPPLSWKFWNFQGTRKHSEGLQIMEFGQIGGVGGGYGGVGRQGSYWSSKAGLSGSQAVYSPGADWAFQAQRCFKYHMIYYRILWLCNIFRSLIHLMPLWYVWAIFFKTTLRKLPRCGKFSIYNALPSLI